MIRALLLLALVGTAHAESPPEPERWLKGSTHVHAAPSGDSTEPIPNVIRWYEQRGYDFIVLTDHNKISEVDGPTEGSPAVRVPDSGLVVLAGAELTHNPSGCLPRQHPSDRCRIHANLLGPTARPAGKIDWAARGTRERSAKYDAVLAQQKLLGGIAQINHPNWYWGMTSALLAELAHRGFQLVEIANSAFAEWDKGDKEHPSTDALWDGALATGATLWGVASDDAHAYHPRGKYPAGGGWIVVRATRAPQAILAAIAAGRFYASTGVELARVETKGTELEIELPRGQRADIEWIENGVMIARVNASLARRTIPERGYLRAVVHGANGARAWVQPARR